jgi:hypothetical protein
MTHSQGLSDNFYPELNQSNFSYSTYFFNTYSNIILSSTPKAFSGVSFLSIYLVKF